VTGERLPDDAHGADVVTELFREGTEPLLYARVSALAGDDQLFRGTRSDFLLGLTGGEDLDLPGGVDSDLPTGQSGQAAASGAGATAAARPPPPRRPAGGIGLGTGGLY
jgi:hypothetical protein